MATGSNEMAGGTVRTRSRALVIDAIRRDGPVSRADLARALAIAKPTVSEIVEGLVAGGLVTESASRSARDRGVGPRGRPPVLLAFNERSAYVLGIHVGVGHTTVVLANAAGTEVARRRIRTPRKHAETALAEIGALAREIVVAARIPRRRLAGVGLCVPGQVDPVAGLCVHAPNLGWRDVPAVGLLETALGVPVAIHNTVQAAAVAEQAEGAGMDASVMALVYAGTGVGAAILDGERVLAGSTGITGELGHMLMPGLDAACACGRHGCVETAASAPAVVRAARDAVATGSPTRLAALGADVTALDVFAAAEAGDTLAQALLGEAGRTLGIAASWLVNLVNPDVLVVAGGLVGSGSHLMDPFRSALEAHTIPAALSGLRVRTSSLGPDAKVRGSVIIALRLTAAGGPVRRA